MLKRYVTEAGSERIEELFGADSAVIYAGQLVRTEIASALGRRIREGVLSRGDAEAVLEAFLLHQRTIYAAVAVTEHVQRSAEQLLFRHPLRAADAIHVANALELVATLRQPLVFLTADRRQADAAGAEGLAVEFVG
jgi:predicted nucleic acid-binding protein